MNKPNFIFKVFLLVLVLSAGSVFAQSENRQPPADPCYEVVLQILVASNGAVDKQSLPPSLAGVVKKLRNNYSFSDYRLTTTFLQRTSNSIEYKSLLNDFGPPADKNTPVFSDWSLRNLKSLPDAAGRRAVQFESFRFGARIPVAIGRLNEESGKTTPVINYESIGITTLRLSLSENEPTVIGSLTTSSAGELMFLILTVRPAE